MMGNFRVFFLFFFRFQRSDLLGSRKVAFQNCLVMEKPDIKPRLKRKNLNTGELAVTGFDASYEFKVQVVKCISALQSAQNLSWDGHTPDILEVLKTKETFGNPKPGEDWKKYKRWADLVKKQEANPTSKPGRRGPGKPKPVKQVSISAPSLVPNLSTSSCEPQHTRNDNEVVIIISESNQRPSLNVDKQHKEGHHSHKKHRHKGHKHKTKHNNHNSSSSPKVDDQEEMMAEEETYDDVEDDWGEFGIIVS
jgi:hypothetical protein